MVHIWAAILNRPTAFNNFVDSGGKSSKNELTTWSCLTFTPFTGHQNLNDLDVSIQAGFTTVGGGKCKLNEVCVL